MAFAQRRARLSSDSKRNILGEEARPGIGGGEGQLFFGWKHDVKKYRTRTVKHLALSLQVTPQRPLLVPVTCCDPSALWWCYPSNAGAQTSICNALNQQSFFRHVPARALPGEHYQIKSTSKSNATKETNTPSICCNTYGWFRWEHASAPMAR